MKIALICPHSYPIPYRNRSGDVCILDLAKGLTTLGHQVYMFAPDGTQWSNLYRTQCSYGKYPPSSQECEEDIVYRYKTVLKQMDIIHDWSSSKRIAEMMLDVPVISTHYGGALAHPNPPRNMVAISEAQKDRLLRGMNDYEGISPEMDRSVAILPKAVHVVHHGIDTGFYTPDKYQKEDFILWIGRWHPVRGYAFAIELAKRTGIRLVMAGCRPEDELSEYQKQCCKAAQELASGWKNISFELLPPDPDHHTAKRELMRKAKAVLQPTQFHEPGGLTQMEIISCGTPCIATNYGSMPETILHATTGFVCDNTVEAFQAAISQVDTIDPVACRKNAMARFDYRLMAKKYLAEYEAILRGETW